MKEGRDLETSMEHRKVRRLFVSGFLLRLPLEATPMFEMLHNTLSITASFCKVLAGDTTTSTAIPRCASPMS